ncbi:MAG: hypothetical protein DME25_11710 [Verrucomicrobia bacterium]|nr:MAG: hypothetical protein DME25_11710 [Verrucomicrobiota bacterium]
MDCLPGKRARAVGSDHPWRGRKESGGGCLQNPAGFGQARCHVCYGHQTDLRETLEAALKGGEDGKVIEPGKSAESMLVHNVAHVGDEDLYMPPPDNKDKIPPLNKDQIGLIRAWIDQGAK